MSADKEMAVSRAVRTIAVAYREFSCLEAIAVDSGVEEDGPVYRDAVERARLYCHHIWGQLDLLGVLGVEVLNVSGVVP